jgi:hypothetical protein
VRNLAAEVRRVREYSQLGDSVSNHQRPPGDVISFADALAAVRENATRQLLLGNGFSRALRDDIFCYNRLLEQADFADLSPAGRLSFERLGTADFEVVMRALRVASMLVALYVPDNPDLAARISRDADGLREVLVATIAHNHPDRPDDIVPEAYSHCRRFLANFNAVYTLNYDLLFYWAIMQVELEPRLNFDDGFRMPEGGEAEYVTWEVEKAGTQSVFYLHGGLHIIDAGTEIRKLTWANTGVALIDQIREALLSDRYPLFVAEGDSAQKLARIKHSSILSHAYQSFSQISGALFVYGHSMSQNDEHIVRLIERNQGSQLFVGLHGDPASEGNQRIIQRAEGIAQARPPDRSLDLRFFSADSAHVWSE